MLGSWFDMQFKAFHELKEVLRCHPTSRFCMSCGCAARRCHCQPLRLKVDTQKYKEWRYCILECFNCTAQCYERTSFMWNGCTYLFLSFLCNYLSQTIPVSSTLYIDCGPNPAPRLIISDRLSKSKLTLALLKLVMRAKDVGSGSRIESAGCQHIKPANQSTPTLAAFANWLTEPVCMQFKVRLPNLS